MTANQNLHKIGISEIVLAIAFGILLGIAVGCTDKKGAVDILEAEGYTDIVTTGYSNWSCSEKDQYKTGFRAKTITGATVVGTVCCGWYKDCTVRIDHVVKSKK